ncbi:fungal-specific transcription factor domain-containing protein [Aspergillus ambiguus]|uniref:Zn(II)2Cys6 transcription factor n=1 Tax=Aspergillus ambiguus TaxID=176160 RepID=UPI003CCD6C35
MPEKKACHTCRRRRVKCDRGVPHCNRCRGAGLECLGYGKLILWNQGVASRGKMMGKTFELPKADSLSSPRPGSPHCSEGRTVSATPASPMVDPLFQDFSPTIRRYLTHFGRTFSTDLVIYDVPDQNPVRQLLRYARDHPVLRHIIVATSAHHLYNLSAPEDASRNSIHNDALMSKNTAIRLLNDELAHLDRFDANITLAAVMLFIYLDFLELGERTWRVHLEGAKSLIRYVKGKNRAGGCVEDLSVHRWLVSEIFILDIIGSTLGFAWSLEPSIYGLEEHEGIESILTMAEVNNFVSCPAQLLKQLLALMQSSQSSSQPHDPARDHQAAAVLCQVQEFNPFGWAFSIQSLSPCKDFNQRVQIASAYKAAICLYVSRLLPPGHPSNYTRDDRQDLVSGVIGHLSQLRPDNGLFKSTMWPCFIAGAEADCPDQRSWVRTHMGTIYKVFPYRSYKSTMETLELMWRQDKQGVSGSPENWLHKLRRLNVDLWVA